MIIVNVCALHLLVILLVLSLILVACAGTLTTDDYVWADVSFRRPTFKLGPLSFNFGGESSVRLATTYLDERIRLGKGSRGSSFVFKRK